MYRLPFRSAQLAARQLLLYQNVFQDEIGQSFLSLVELLSTAEANINDYDALVFQYGRLFRQLAMQPPKLVFCADWWQNYLLERILADNNPFSQQAYLNRGEVNGILQQAAAYDLSLLHELFLVTGSICRNALVELHQENNLIPPISWNGTAVTKTDPRYDSTIIRMLRQLANSDDWSKLVPALIAYYAELGTDNLSRYRAFRWQHTDSGGYLEPIRSVDEPRLENLVGYERERAPLIQNTEQFLAELPANHALLYGARGTGKSSTVKALLTRYGGQGLRLIEVPKHWLGDYALIADTVRERPEKFILFVDDLSFEAEESDYKDLKALLEGSLEARPNNLLIYATSNRRHLIKEQFSDSPRPEDEEINAWDTVEEKLSLSDRFGLTITFSSPNQIQYLKIVQALAQQAGLDLPTEELNRAALQWEMRHSGFSGRVARQFIDHLNGQIRLQSLKDK